MRKFCFLLFVVAGSLCAQTPNVTISDTFSLAVGGAPAFGSVQIAWPNFTSASGQAYPAGNKIVTIPSDGTFSTTLQPSDRSSPPFQYTVTYFLGSGQSSWITDKWIVPTTASTLSIAQVRANQQAANYGDAIPIGQVICPACKLGDVPVFNGNQFQPATVRALYPGTFTTDGSNHVHVSAAEHAQGVNVITHWRDASGNDLSPAVKVDPVTGDVDAYFDSATSGNYFIDGGSIAPNFAQSFYLQTTATIPQSTHHFATPNIDVAVYDPNGNLIHSGVQIQVDPATYAVNVTFGAPTTFKVVILGALGTAQPANSGSTSYTFSTPLSASSGAVSIALANSSTDGALSHQDWTTFNSKLGDPGANGIVKRTAAGTTGTASASDLPTGYSYANLSNVPTQFAPVNPAATTLGGVESIAPASHQWIDSISTAGVPHQSQPTAGDISGLGTAATHAATDFQAAGTYPTFDQVSNPAASTNFTWGAHTLTHSFTSSSPGLNIVQTGTGAAASLGQGGSTQTPGIQFQTQENLAPFNIQKVGTYFTDGGQTFFDDGLMIGFNGTTGGQEIVAGQAQLSMQMESDYWNTNQYSGLPTHAMEWSLNYATPTLSAVGRAMAFGIDRDRGPGDNGYMNWNFSIGDANGSQFGVTDKTETKELFDVSPAGAVDVGQDINLLRTDNSPGIAAAYENTIRLALNDGAGVNTHFWFGVDRITFGTAQDINLYRSASNTLKTTDNLIVAQAATVAGLQTATRTVTAATDTATLNDNTINCKAASNAETESLPASPSTGEWLNYKKIDSSANTCTLSGNGKNIEGSTTYALATQYKYVRVQYDGAQWWIYGNN